MDDKDSILKQILQEFGIGEGQIESQTSTLTEYRLDSVFQLEGWRLLHCSDPIPKEGMIQSFLEVVNPREMVKSSIWKLTRTEDGPSGVITHRLRERADVATTNAFVEALNKFVDARLKWTEEMRFNERSC